jgi:hypothetical protein
MATTAVDLEEKLSSFSDHWAPKVVTRLRRLAGRRLAGRTVREESRCDVRWLAHR